MEVEWLPESANGKKYNGHQTDCGDRDLRCKAAPIVGFAQPQFTPTFAPPVKPDGKDWYRYQRLKEPAQPHLRQPFKARDIRCDVKDAAERQVLHDNAGSDGKKPDDKLANQVHAGQYMDIFYCGIVITVHSMGNKEQVNNALKRLALNQLPVPVASNNEEQG